MIQGDLIPFPILDQMPLCPVSSGEMEERYQLDSSQEQSRRNALSTTTKRKESLPTRVQSV